MSGMKLYVLGGYHQAQGNTTLKSQTLINEKTSRISSGRLNLII
jgi:hypothetical protein